MTNELLFDPIRHNNWATVRLLEFVRDQQLTAEQSTATGVGTFGDVQQTFDHIIRCDAGYLGALSGSTPDWVGSGQELDLDGLHDQATGTARRWEHWLSEPFDPERVIIIDDGTEGVHAGIILAQAINHANHHREQVCAILTGLGIQPPDIQAWAYAWHTGRIWRTGG